MHGRTVKKDRNEFRDIDYALAESSRMVDLITKSDSEITTEDRERLTRETTVNFSNYINKGYLVYRKSVTESGDFALTEWKGEGSILTDVLGREFIDVLGGFGIYSASIRHPGREKAKAG